MSESWDAIVVGAGAAGVFAALRAKELSPSLRLIILERSPNPLRKVAISGGGRCNVTHDCQDLDFLLSCYPRGGPRLEPILNRFMPQDTVEWFEKRGVRLKTESDGRMFPVTNSSQTVIDCLLREANRLGIELRTKARVDALVPNRKGFRLKVGQDYLQCRRLLLATGGASKATDWLEAGGHELIPDIPSLFTFCCKHPVLEGLQGLSLAHVTLTLKTEPVFQAEGPFLITHWGLSGPAVLKLSAFAARSLAEVNYSAPLLCDFLPAMALGDLEVHLAARSEPSQVSTQSAFSEIPKRLWKRLVEHSGIGAKMSWKKLPPESRRQLALALKQLSLEISGKGVFKEEFVTSGGLPLKELDVYSMESKRVPGLFVAGELLDVDGITGGFNFQNAWATGYIAGEGLASGLA